MAEKETLAMTTTPALSEKQKDALQQLKDAAPEALTIATIIAAPLVKAKLAERVPDQSSGMRGYGVYRATAA